jgi:tripartite ATP-independent transporter DctP family solute receptor
MMLVAATFFGLMLLGMPVAFVLGIAGLVGMAQIGERFLAMGPDRFFSGLNLFPFLAMPFFILVGEIMNRTGITDRLVGFAYSLVGYLRGGMAHSNMVASVFFAGITGSATADAAAFGNTLVPAMVKQGYSRPFACAVTAAGSIIGPTIPPSTLMIIYGSLMGVSIELFPNGQLGRDDEVIQMVKDGLVESSINSAGGLAAHYELVGIFDVPFAFPNIAKAHEVMNLAHPFGQMLADDIAARTDIKVLGLLDSGGFFVISNSRRPITSVDDMAGLKIRTMTLPNHEAIISSLGGQPTPLPWAEVYTALQTGVADGQMNPIPIMAFAKFQEVQQYLTITNHIITPYIWLINADFYDGLTDQERYVIDYAAKVAVDAGRGISRIMEASDNGLPAPAAAMEVNALGARSWRPSARQHSRPWWR